MVLTWVCGWVLGVGEWGSCGVAGWRRSWLSDGLEEEEEDMHVFEERGSQSAATTRKGRGWGGWMGEELKERGSRKVRAQRKDKGLAHTHTKIGASLVVEVGKTPNRTSVGARLPWPPCGRKSKECCRRNVSWRPLGGWASTWDFSPFFLSCGTPGWTELAFRVILDA